MRPTQRLVRTRTRTAEQCALGVLGVAVGERVDQGLDDGSAVVAGSSVEGGELGAGRVANEGGGAVGNQKLDELDVAVGRRDVKRGQTVLPEDGF
jgi:hypothetical protein